ncbi:MAG: hypothetical protein HYY22_09370 [Thaumarchaeota archaeon]|nr:hypothetical protein [Nitrososphaerota archaeon]
MLGSPFTGTPELVLKRGTVGSFNLTLASNENKTVLATLGFGGIPPYNYGWGQAVSLPSGITYTIEPRNNITIAPRSYVTATIRIAATNDTAIRSYNLTFSVFLQRSDTKYEDRGYSSVLKVIDTPPATSNTNVTSSYSTMTITFTSTATTTLTVTDRVTTAPSMTTTTETITTRETDFLAYAWAIGATVVAAILAVVSLRRRS